MMISHKHRCIFINIPKCASVSIMNALDMKLVTPPHWHCSWSDSRQVLGKEILDSYFKFSIVRNPWDRVVSAWMMFEQHDYRKQDRSYTLPEFLEVITDQSIDYKTTYQTQQEKIAWQHTVTNIRHHTLPALHPYYGLVNKNGNIKANFTGKQENLHEDLAKVCRSLGLRSLQLKTINTTRRGHYTDYFNETTMKIVTSYYKKDIDTFNYSF